MDSIGEGKSSTSNSDSHNCVIIFIAAFDHHFGALDNRDDLLGKTFKNALSVFSTSFFRRFSAFSAEAICLRVSMFGSPSNGAIAISNVNRYIPRIIRELMANYAPNSKLTHIRETAKIMKQAVKEIIVSKSDALVHGKGGKDLMSLLSEVSASRLRVLMLMIC